MADETDRIRADIEQTRGELGETVQALATELDPRTHAGRAAGDVRQKARTQWQRIEQAVRSDPRPAIAAGALLVVLMLRRRK
jgi:hypothetical protein